MSWYLRLPCEKDNNTQNLFRFPNRGSGRDQAVAGIWRFPELLKQQNTGFTLDKLDSYSELS